jgi:aminoglycoside/choline kinase family phosphotransferase
VSGGGNGIRTAAERRVHSFLSRRFGGRARCEGIAGDASERCFFRIHAPGLSPLVAVVHPEPFDLEELPYFAVGNFLRGIGARVPAIVSSYPGEGILLVQDLGDRTMLSALEGASRGERLELYRRAVHTILHLQDEGTRTLTPDLPSARSALDRERLLFELRFFSEHYVGGLLGGPLDPDRERELDAWFEELAGTAAGYERVLCHRDFHSRNLMIRSDDLWMVDFQDARLGPYTYDLASLLSDSYVDVPEEVVEEMLELYRSQRARQLGRELPASRLREEYEVTCLQRNIKALGTFGYQATVRVNRRYLEDVPRTLEKIRLNLMRRGIPEILELFQGPLLLT